MEIQITRSRYCHESHSHELIRGCRGRGRDHMVVGFKTTCAISAYHH